MKCVVCSGPLKSSLGDLWLHDNSSGWYVGRQMDHEAVADKQPPYPWCPGNPTRQACAELGYCARKPNCGE